jgi:hypothetical protein
MVILHLTEQSKSLLKEILSNVRWYRYNNHFHKVEDDYTLAKAITFLFIESIIEPMSDLTDLRVKYNLHNIDSFIEAIAGYYME